MRQWKLALLATACTALAACAPVARPDIPPDEPIEPDRTATTQQQPVTSRPPARPDQILAAARARIPRARISSCEQVPDQPPGQRHDAFRCSGIYVEHGDECVATFLARGATIVAGPLNPVCEPEFPWQGR